MNRRRRHLRRLRARWAWLIGTAIAVVAILAIFVPQNRGEAPETTPTPLPGVFTYPDRQQLRRAEVVKVIDGDTIDVKIGGKQERIRYYGIDTPERGDRCFAEARDRNRQLADDEVLLLPDTRDIDRYGRLLRYVFTSEGLSVDASLIAEGYAHAWREDGAFRENLITLEEEAQERASGCLWK